MSQPKDDLTGTVLNGRYLLAARIGRGGMGTVYRARDLQTSDEVAIKVLTQDRAAKRRHGDRFKREMRALHMVRHPNTVTILDHGETPDGHLWYAMDLVDGHTLGRFVGSKPCDASDIEAVARQLLAALASIHQAGLVHRDLKPGNVMIRRGDDGGLHVIVLDFGIVRFVDPDPDMSVLTAQNTILGTPEFIAPELVRTGSSDHRADLYAVGLCLFVMSTGKVPYKGETTAATLRAHVHEPVPDLDARREQPLPRRMRKLIEALLRKEPVDRPQTALDALRILDGTAQVPRQRTRLKRGVVLSLLGAALLGILIGAAAVAAIALYLM